MKKKSAQKKNMPRKKSANKEEETKEPVEEEIAKEEGNDVEKEQPVLNIGMVGHVDHGKTTLLERLSGKWADTHSEEIRRGITIRLGYADVVFRKCKKCNEYTVKKKCPACGGETIALKKVSFVDAPGHESLMATMLAGATIMDGALLLISANESCPQPQTREHLMALEIIGVKNIVIVQNKIDLVSEENALKNYEQIKEFIKGTRYENSAIIPVSAQHSVGLSALIEAIGEHIKMPARDAGKEPIMLIARSFDINKPGMNVDDIVGGVLGGSLKQGKLKKGEEVEIRPGYERVEKNRSVWKPIKTRIAALKTGGMDVDEVCPGGSIGVLTLLDPSIVQSDKLTGSVLGLAGKLPPVWNELVLEVTLLQRVVGAKEELTVQPVKMGETLMLNVNSSATVGIVTELRKNSIKCKLKLPVCASIGSRVTISRMIANRFRLIGYGMIRE